MAQADPKSSRDRSWWMVMLSMCALYLVIRSPGLMGLPIFGDEAIYLRWAQLIREGHWWVSLCDPKPPLHFWILAWVFHWTRDPLKAARVVSVAAGMLSVPAIMLLCGELGLLIKGQHAAPSGRTLGMLAALLMIFCPFLAFYQRFATADALFFLEMLVVVWLSLRWGRLLALGQTAWKTAVAMGVAFSAAMMTRQGLSYVLWAMPIVVLVGSGALFHRFRRAMGTLMMAACVAAVLWSPFLFARLGPFPAENGGMVAELKRRIFYQDSFTGGKESRIAVAQRNLVDAFVPSLKDNTPQTGWLFYYLTPAVYVTSFLGLVIIAMRRQWRLLLFLSAWIGLLLILPLVMLSTMYSRYLLAGTAPLLVATAYAVAECLAWIVSRRAPALLLWSAAAFVFVGLLATPVLELGVQSTHWEKQIFVGHDRYQYLTGWTFGGPARAAIAAIQKLATEGPVTVITDEGGGTPTDAVWVYLSHNPNIRLYYTPHDNHGVILTPVPGTPHRNMYLLRKDKYLFTPPVLVEFSPDDTIFYITNDPLHPNGPDISAEEYFHGKNPNLGLGISFDEIAGGERVLVFPLKLDDASTLQAATQE